MASIIGVETLQHTNGTTAATIDSSGRVSTPARPSFKAYADDGWIGISGNTDTVFAFDHTEHNVGSHYSTGTKKFTCPVDGLYVFTAQAYINQTTDAETRIVIKRVNNTAKNLSFVNWQKLDHDQTVAASVHYYATAGDEIQAVLFTVSYTHLTLPTILRV